MNDRRKSSRIEVYAPPDHKAAMQAAAAKADMTLSEWLAFVAVAALPLSVQKNLSARPAAHRPKKT